MTAEQQDGQRGAKLGKQLPWGLKYSCSQQNHALKEQQNESSVYVSWHGSKRVSGAIPINTS